MSIFPSKTSLVSTIICTIRSDWLFIPWRRSNLIPSECLPPQLCLNRFFMAADGSKVHIASSLLVTCRFCRQNIPPESARSNGPGPRNVFDVLVEIPADTADSPFNFLFVPSPSEFHKTPQYRYIFNLKNSGFGNSKSKTCRFWTQKSPCVKIIKMSYTSRRLSCLLSR